LKNSNNKDFKFAFGKLKIISIVKLVLSFFIKLVKQITPLSYQYNLWALIRGRPRVGKVDFGSLRRLTPISNTFGFDRGLPVDRYYIEKFVCANAKHIKGRVLEIGDATYTRKFGRSNVSQSDVLHLEEGNPEATIVADLTKADHISSNTFDCIILTQTLQFIFDVTSALSTIYRILKPGGVLLATLPGISQIDKQWAESCYWAFTVQSAHRLFKNKFASSDLKIEAYGNVLSAISFLQGLAVEDLHIKDLDYNDSSYQLIIGIKAVKPYRKL